MSDVAMNLNIDGDASGAIAAADSVSESLGGMASAAQGAGEGAAASGAQAKEAGNGFEGLASGAKSAIGGISGLSPEFGKASGAGKELVSVFSDIGEGGGSLAMGFAGVVAGAAALGGLFLELGHSGAELSHEIASQMALTGMHADTLDVYDKALEDVGGSTAGLTSGSRIFTSQLYQLQDAQIAGNPLTRKQRDEMEMLGGTLYNGTGQMKSFAEAFPEVLKNLAAMEDHTKRNQITTDLFGRSSSDIKLLLDNYTPSLIKAAEQSEKLGLTDEKVTQTNIKYNQAMTDLKTTYEGLALQATPGLISVLGVTSDALDFVGDHWHTVTGAVGLATSALRTYIEPARFAIATTLDFAQGIDFGPVVAGVDMVRSAISSLASLPHPDFSGIFSGLSSAATSVAGVVGSVFGSISGIVSSAMGAIGGAISSGASVFSILSDAAQNVVGFVTGIFNGAVSAIGSAVGAIGSVLATGAAAFNVLVDAASSVANAVVGVFNSMADGVANAISGIVDAINSVADAISSIPVVGGVFDGLTGRAAGGPVEAGQAYIVGENSPELFIPNTSGVILPPSSSRPGTVDFGGGGGGMTVNNYLSINQVIGITNLEATVKGWMRDVAQNQTGLRGYLQTAS